MRLATTRLHHSQKALGVDDLTPQLKVAERLVGRGRARRRSPTGLDRLGTELEHVHGRAFDGRAAKLDHAAIEAGDLLIGAVLAERHQQAGNTGAFDHVGDRSLGDAAGDRGLVGKVEVARVERLLLRGEDDRQRDREQGHQHDRSAHEAGNTGRRLLQVADVELVTGLTAVPSALFFTHGRQPSAPSPITAGALGVPGGFGRGCTQTSSPSSRAAKVGIFSVNGGGEAPSSGRYW